MPSPRVYLDYNATAPVRPEVAEAMRPLLGLPLNPSSVHAEGRHARSIVETARRTIAEHIGTFPNEIVFTGSGTEANNTVLRACAHLPFFLSGIEHPSLYKTARTLGNPASIPVTPGGAVDREALERLLPASGSFLLCVMLANNETGVIQPVAEIAAIAHARGGLVHCDAAQALGKMPVDFSALGCDFMTLSAHKMGGPVGAAALLIRNGQTLAPLLTGGGQELNRRAGTEQVAAIAGFAEAVRRIDLAQMQKLRQWLEAFERAAPPNAVLFGASSPRLPNTTCIALPALKAETQVIRLDLSGIAVSAGAACTSGKVEPSRILRAMGADDRLAANAIRISGGWATREADILALTRAWGELGIRKTAAP